MTSLQAQQPKTSNKRRVPHISLVFREMWDTTALNRQLYRSSLRSKPNDLHFHSTPNKPGRKQDGCPVAQPTLSSRQSLILLRSPAVSGRRLVKKLVIAAVAKVDENQLRNRIAPSLVAVAIRGG
jgi:hypothetical protein